MPKKDYHKALRSWDHRGYCIQTFWLRAGLVQEGKEIYRQIVANGEVLSEDQLLQFRDLNEACFPAMVGGLNRPCVTSTCFGGIILYNNGNPSRPIILDQFVVARIAERLDSTDLDRLEMVRSYGEYRDQLRSREKKRAEIEAKRIEISLLEVEIDTIGQTLAAWGYDPENPLFGQETSAGE